MGAIFSILLCPITIPVKIFRSLMTILSLLWSAVFIAILIYTGLNWNKVKGFFNDIASKVDDLKNIVGDSKDKIEELADEVKDLADKVA